MRRLRFFPPVGVSVEFVDFFFVVEFDGIGEVVRIDDCRSSWSRSFVDDDVEEFFSSSRELYGAFIGLIDDVDGTQWTGL